MRPIDADALFNNMEEAFWYSNHDRDEIAEKLVLEAPTVNGWTSVKDGLPKENGKYLCVWQGRSIDTGMFTNGHFRLYGEVKDKLVSHWMPLPELPKEGGAKE